MSLMKKFFFLAGLLRGFRSGFSKIQDKTRIISILNEPSFGHKITGLDYLARLFSREKVQLFVLVTGNVNKPLFDLYRNYFNYHFIVPWSYTKKKFRKLAPAEAYGIEKGILLSLIVRSVKTLIPHPTLLYRVLNTEYDKMEVYKFSDNTQKVSYETFYSHCYLIDRVKLSRFGLEKEQIISVEKVIAEKAGGIASRKIVSVIFRSDATLHNNQHDQNRDAGPVSNYEKAIRYLSDKQHIVLLFGNRDFSALTSFPGVIDSRTLEISMDLLNIYSLTQSYFVVMQHSGPLHLANTAGIPLVITDFLPLWQGSCGKKDIFVPKNFIHIDSGERIPLKSILKQHSEIFFGGYNRYPGIAVEPSSSDDIFDAVKEMSELLEGINFIDNDMLKAYQQYIPQKSLHAYRNNRISKELFKKEFL